MNTVMFDNEYKIVSGCDVINFIWLYLYIYMYVYKGCFPLLLLITWMANSAVLIFIDIIASL